MILQKIFKKLFYEKILKNLNNSKKKIFRNFKKMKNDFAKNFLEILKKLFCQKILKNSKKLFYQKKIFKIILS